MLALFAALGSLTKTAPTGLATAGADIAVPDDFFDACFVIVNFPLAAALTGAFLAFAELFPDALPVVVLLVLDEAFNVVDVRGLLAELGVTLTWLFFLPQPS